MAIPPYASWMLEQEARALLTRLARVKPFALQETMLPAAGLLPTSQIAIESFLTHGRRKLQRLIRSFLRFLKTAPPWMDAAGAQRRFSILRLRFVGVLTHFDLFNDVITQRSENEIGVWLSGLDVVSADALKLRQPVFDPPPVICYLDRGVGAAIRPARTRLPGGGDNPAAIIKVPRERMVGSGIASSLIHEVGHQAAALLGLVESLRPEIRRKRAAAAAMQTHGATGTGGSPRSSRTSGRWHGSGSSGGMSPAVTGPGPTCRRATRLISCRSSRMLPGYSRFTR